MKRLLLAALLLSLPGAALAQTAVPVAITYQGRVLDSTGAALGNGTAVTKPMIFRLWNIAAGGTNAANLLYSELQNVTILNGEFSVLVGKGSPVTGEANAKTLDQVFATATSDQFFLGVTVDNGTEISPRQQIVTTPLAFRAKVADSLAPGATQVVTNANLATGAVKAAQLDVDAVEEAKIKTSAVSLNKLADNSVNGAKIVDGSIGLADLGTNSVDGSKIVDGSIAAADLGDGSVATAKIADGAVTLAKHATNSVDGTKIVDGSVALADLATNSVDTSKIVDGAVNTAELADRAVTGAKIALGTVGLGNLDTATKSVLTKPRQIYDQGLNPATGTIDPSPAQRFTLIPIDIESLGNDADGCKISIIAQHRTTFWDYRVDQLFVWLQQPGFTADPNYPNIINGYTHGTYTGTGNGVAYWTFALGDGKVTQRVGNTADDWVRIYTYYPGVLRTSSPAPYNVDQAPVSSNAAANGPDISLTGSDIASIAGSGSIVTVTLKNPHGLGLTSLLVRTGESNPSTLATIVTIASSVPSGAGAAINAPQTLTAVPDPYTFQFTVSGTAAASYTGGTINYKLGFTKFRVWAAVHPDVSARIIVSDR